MSIVIVSKIAAGCWSKIVEVEGVARLALEFTQIREIHCVRVIQRGDIAFVFDRSAGGLSAVSDPVLCLSVDAKGVVR